MAGPRFGFGDGFDVDNKLDDDGDDDVYGKPRAVSIFEFKRLGKINDEDDSPSCKSFSKSQDETGLL